jgi:hypothetical protein
MPALHGFSPNNNNPHPHSIKKGWRNTYSHSHSFRFLERVEGKGKPFEAWHYCPKNLAKERAIKDAE